MTFFLFLLITISRHQFLNYELTNKQKYSVYSVAQSKHKSFRDSVQYLFIRCLQHFSSSVVHPVFPEVHVSIVRSQAASDNNRTSN